MIGDGEEDRAGIYNYVHDGLTEMKLETGQTAMIEKEKSGFTPKTLSRVNLFCRFLMIDPHFCGHLGLIR